MTVPPEPGDFNRPDWSDEDQRLRASMENELPPRRLRSDEREDLPEIYSEASYARIAVYAVAAVLIVCVVFYGMSHIRTETASNPAPATTANNMAANPAPPARNTQPGTTTGAAPSTMAKAPGPATTGSGAPTR